MDLDDADLLTHGDQEIDRLARRIRARAHDHQNALGIRRAEVVEQAVAPAGQLGELVHRRFDGAPAPARRMGSPSRAPEVDVGVLRGAADEWVVGVERAPMRDHQILVDHRPDLLVGQQGELVDLVRGAEAVEKWMKGMRDSASPPARSTPCRALPGPSWRRAERSRWAAPPSRPGGRRRSTGPASPATGRRRGSRKR